MKQMSPLTRGLATVPAATRRSVRMRVAVLAAVVALAATTTGIAVAGTGPIPGNQAYCGASGGGYSACVVMVNATRGFSGPGTTSPLAGIGFVVSAAHSSPSGLRGSWNYRLDGGSTAPPNGWMAIGCHANRGYSIGCDMHHSIVPSQAAGGSRSLVEAVITETHGRAITFHSWQHFRSTSNDSRCTSHNPFVACVGKLETGIKDYRRWTWTLVTETVMISFTNRLNQRLTLTNAIWAGLIEDARGRTPVTTFANGQRNSSAAVAANLPGGPVPTAFFGALRPTDHTERTVVLTYQVQPGTGTEGSFYTGQTIRIRVRIDASGSVDTNHTTCTVSADSTFGAAQCRITGSSYSNRNSEVSIELLP